MEGVIVEEVDVLPVPLPFSFFVRSMPGAQSPGAQPFRCSGNQAHAVRSANVQCNAGRTA